MLLNAQYSDGKIFLGANPLKLGQVDARLSSIVVLTEVPMPNIVREKHFLSNARRPRS
jgi:hypothetical protein